MREEIQIATADGSCRTMLCTPDRAYPPRVENLPAVILYMDAVGYRPELWDQAENLAQLGYVVIAPDLFYRQGPYEPKVGRILFADPEATNAFLAPRFGAYTPELQARDTDAFVAFLQARDDVQPAFGASGYCMGGAMAMCAAAAYPELFKAVASYHGGNLASDAANSAHLLAPAIKAELYFGVAKDDPTFPAEQETRLVAALDSASNRYTLEHYDAHHGFSFSDHPAYTPEAGARQWRTMTELFARTMK